MKPLPRYITIEKNVGETPLVALERARHIHALSPEVPLAYAGRLDPMASGTLLILVGEECKKQSTYHTLDKEYSVELLLGVSSDTGDVLGRLTFENDVPHVTEKECKEALKKFRGTIALPYPHFSSKTVRGKPLHMWTLEGRLNEIEVPIKHSRIHTLVMRKLTALSRDVLVATARTKIESIPKVTDPRKALGEDFRRDAVRADWRMFSEDASLTYQVLTFTCIASSGTYMRTLCEHIAQALGTRGLALSIHRTNIGHYLPLTHAIGLWKKRF